MAKSAVGGWAAGPRGVFRAGALRTEPEPRLKEGRGRGAGLGAQCPGRGGASVEAQRGGSPTDR